MRNTLPSITKPCGSSSTQTKNHSYSILFLFAVGLMISFVLLAILGELFLRNVGESLQAKEIIQIQLANQQRKCLAGPVLSNFEFLYKKALVETIQPTVLALGSSRVAQFRDSFFSVPFVNAGVAMTSIEEGEIFFKDVIVDQPPEMVIFGIDVWWFNAAFNSSKPTLNPARSVHENVHYLFSPQKIASVYQEIWKGKLTKDQFLKGALGILPDHCGLGIEGRFNMRGFGPDGSSYYMDTIAGQVARDPKFQDSLAKIQRGNPRTTFSHGTMASPKQLQQFVTLLSKFKEHAIKVAVFFPPFPTAINTAMDEQKNGYAYISDLKKQLRISGIQFYDFTDPKRLGSHDCEFFDGIHGGEVIYARILKAIYDTDPSVRLFINIAYLEHVINQYQGNTFIPDKKVTSLREVDFLGIGCKKVAN